MEEAVVIVGFARTPMGMMQGQLASLSATDLGAHVISAAVKRSGLAVDAVNQVIMGCVLPAGVGQAPARQAAIKAGLPHSVSTTTINKVCGSGMKSVMMAAQALKLGGANVVVAGGMESMSNAPHLLANSRSGYRLGHGQLLDHMFVDGLQNAQDGLLMGCFADKTAEHFTFSRESQDAFALRSLERAVSARESGAFSQEIAEMTIPNKQGAVSIVHDEGPTVARPDKIPLLKPAFRPDGTVTAANASSIADGAAALVLTTEAYAKQHQLAIKAYIRADSEVAQAPEWFTTAPVKAVQSVFEKLTWSPGSTDLFEINEAFAVVSMAAMHELKLSEDQVNIHGGACALGHPLGASGARIIVTLLVALERHGLKRGIASLCIGGGEATALAIERPREL